VEINSTQKPIKYIAIATLVLGLILRFHNLGLHPYWHDEVYTSLQMGGHEYSIEHNTPVFKTKVQNRIITAQELDKFLYPNPASTIVDSVKLIAQNDSFESPLYYVLLRFWVDIFGNSIAVIRGFSALLGVAVSISIYWLSMELFRSKTTAWITLALVSVSPFHLIYSQEARCLMLWMLTIVLSHIALLRAINQPKAINWIFYSISLILALYSFLLSVLVLAGHIVFLLVYDRFRLSKRVINFLVSALSAFVCYCPWLISAVYFIFNFHISMPLSYKSILKVPFWYLSRWLHNLGLVFADFNVGEISPKIHQILYALLLIAILCMVIVAMRFFYQHSNKLNHIFLLSAIVIPFLPLFFKDLISGGGYTQVIRYLSPCWIAIELIVAYWLGNKIESKKTPRIIWQSILTSLIILGLSSDILMTNSELWWNKLDANFFKQYADQVVSKAKHPLIINDDSYIPSVISFSSMVDPNVRFFLFSENGEIHIPKGESEVYLFRPSKKLVKKIQKNYTLEHVPLKDAYPGGGITSEHFYRVIIK